MRALSRLTDWALSSRTSLGVAASVDGVLRVSPELVVPIISVTGGIFGPSDVATATTWLLFFTMLYEFAPLAYSQFEQSEAVFSQSNRGFRFLFAIGGCVSGVIWIKSGDSFSAGLSGLMLCTYWGLGGGMIAYLSQRHNWNVLNPEGPALATFFRYAPTQSSDLIDELKTTLSQEGWKRSLAVIVYLLTLCSIFGFPIIIAGLVLFTLSLMFPVADLILFSWAVAIRVFPRLSVGPERSQLAELTGDIEEFFIDSIEYVSSDPRGIAIAFNFVGIGLSAIVLALSSDLWVILDEIVRNNTAYQQTIQSPGIDRQWLYLLPWNVFGCLTLFLIGGTSGLWVWIRELKRFPAAAAVWGEHLPEVDMSSPPPRIPGFILLPTLATATAAFWVTAANGFEALNRGVAVYDWVVAGAWPAVVILTLWTIYKNKRAQRSGELNSVTHEHWWIAVGVGIQIASVFFPALPMQVEEIVFPLGASMSLAVLLESLRYVDRFDDIRRHADVGCLILICVFFVAYARVFETYATSASVLSPVFLFLGLVLAAGRLIDDHIYSRE